MAMSYVDVPMNKIFFQMIKFTITTSVTSVRFSCTAGYIQTSLSKIQGPLKDFPTVFKDNKSMKNTDLSVKCLLQKCQTEIMEKLVLEH